MKGETVKSEEILSEPEIKMILEEFELAGFQFKSMAKRMATEIRRLRAAFKEERKAYRMARKAVEVASRLVIIDGCDECGAKGAYDQHRVYAEVEPSVAGGGHVAMVGYSCVPNDAVRRALADATARARQAVRAGASRPPRANGRRRG